MSRSGSRRVFPQTQDRSSNAGQQRFASGLADPRVGAVGMSDRSILVVLLVGGVLLGVRQVGADLTAGGVVEPRARGSTGAAGAAVNDDRGALEAGAAHGQRGHLADVGAEHVGGVLGGA